MPIDNRRTSDTVWGIPMACILFGLASNACAQDPFSDVDLIAPFVNRPQSWTSEQVAPDETQRMLTFAAEQFADFESGRCVRRASWTEKPADLSGSNWGSHSVRYSVFAFPSEDAAIRALDVLSTKEFDAAYQAKWDEINSNYAKQAQEWQAKPKRSYYVSSNTLGRADYMPGAVYTSSGTTSYHHEEYKFDPGALQAERKSSSLIFESERAVTGTKETGGTCTITETLTGDKWLSWWAKMGFARRGRFILTGTVDVSAYQQRTTLTNWMGPYLINRSPTFPGDLWQTVQAMLADAHEGRPLKGPADDIIADDGIPLEVKVYAKGYGAESDYFLTDGVPSEIAISGTVADQYGDPVIEATVVLVEKNMEAKTDSAGRYIIRATDNGKTPYSTTVDFTLIKQMSGLEARLIHTSLITANAKTTEVMLEVSDEKGPLRNKEIEISDTIGFMRGGKTISYVSTRNSNSIRGTTDQNGQLALTLYHPDSIKELPAGLAPDAAFPVTGFLKVRVIETKSETTLPYSVESPFPRITDVTTGRFLEAGQWQIQPSEITIADGDSDSFTVTLKGPGAFKAQGDTASEGTGHPRLLYHKIEGKTFRFHYRPKFDGFDLNNQPAVLKELAETAGNVYLSVLTNVGGEKLLDQAALHYPGQSVTRGLLINDNGIVSTVYISGTLRVASDGAKKALSNAGDISNVANLTFKTYAGQDEILRTLKGQGSTEDVIVTTDTAIGLTDTALGLTGKLTSTSGKLYWEAMKASWELDKTAYKISKQYYDIAEAYQDVKPENVTVTVEDETGRKVSAVATFKVLVWKGGA